MKNKLKWISVLLTLCLVCSLFSGFSVVTSGETIPKETPAEEILPQETSTTEEPVNQEPFTLPDIIEPEEAAEKGYVGREKEAEENLSSFVFQNADGTNTLRLFSHPVKYVAADGKIRDISLDIQAKSGGGFVTKDHEIITTFAKRLEDGISLDYKDVNLRLVPALSGTNPAATLSNDGKTVSYIKDSKTAFVYQLTYTGFKEDIVVKQYTGQTEYEFTLYTGGLALVKENGSYFLTDSDGQVKATIGDIIVFTADEKNNTLGEMTYQTVEANQQYTLTVHLDGEYLADPATAYPIRIDPTVEITYDNLDSGTIQDVTIQENATYSGTLGSLYVGRHEGGYLSRVLMRFPGLDLSDTNADNILSASVELRDLMCQGSQNITIDCCIYNSSAPAWSESTTTTWSSVGTDYIGSVLDSQLITYGNGNVESNRYSFDIIEVVKDWKNGLESPEKGLVFKANSTFENGSSAIWYKTFASFNRSAYQPSMTVTYNSFANARQLTLNSGDVLDIYSSGERVMYSFTPSASGFYTFESFDRYDCDPYVWFYNYYYEELGRNDDDGGDLNFSITYHLQSGSTYYFSAGCYSNQTGSYCVRISNATSISSPSLESIHWEESKNVVCNIGQEVAVYRFVPETSGEYLFYSRGATWDPRAWLYNANLTSVAENDDGAGGSNFRIAATLTAGQTYYFVAGNFRYRYGNFQLRILKGANIANNTYYLKNVSSNKYVDIVGPYEQEWIHQWHAHDGYQERWSVQRQSDGYYTVRSLFENQYYIGISSTEPGVDNITLHSSVSADAKWRIFETPSGGYVFEPATAPGTVLSAPNDLAGTYLQTDDLYLVNSDNNKWNINKGLYIAFMNNYFDNGYSVYYGESSSESINKINSYIEEVSEMYFALFGLRVLNNNTSYYQSPIDICKGTVTVDNLNTLCTAHGHTSRESVKNSFMNLHPAQEKTTETLWSCHCITSTATNGDPNYNRSFSFGHAIFILGKSSPSTRGTKTKGLLVHELNHQYGARDHYHELANSDDEESCKFKERCSLCGINKRPESCIMYNSSTEITRNDIICSECKTDMITHLAAYNAED